MRKFIAIKDFMGDSYEKVFDTLGAANEYAEAFFNDLAPNAKLLSRCYVISVEDNEKYLYKWAFKENKVDYNAWHYGDVEEGYFDSNELMYQFF